MEHDVRATFEEIGLVDNERNVDWEVYAVKTQIKKKLIELIFQHGSESGCF